MCGYEIVFGLKCTGARIEVLMFEKPEHGVVIRSLYVCIHIFTHTDTYIHTHMYPMNDVQQQ